MTNEKKNNPVDPCRVRTPVARLSYPNLFKPKAFSDEQKPKCSCVLLFDKKTDISSLKAACNAAMAAKFGSDKAKWPKGMKSPFNDGDLKEDQPAYKNTVYISAKNNYKPLVVDQKKQPVDEESNTVYAGCYVKASLRAFVYGGKGTPYKPGISFSLDGIQKVSDGEAFGGRASVDDMFDEIADSSEDESNYADGVGGSDDEEENSSW